MQTSGATTAQAVLASNELLADWLDDFARGVRDEIAELTPEALA
jgi:hypothetical protein